MQIGSGQTPLSLAVLKTLGVQLPTPPQGAAPGGTAASGPGSAAKVSAAKAGGTAPTGDPAAAAAEAGRDLGVAKTIPRGSFIDLKA